MSELFVGFYLLFCGCYDLMYGKNYFYIFLYMQAIAFFILAFGYVGTFDPNS
jgi:beta-mannan synthase